MKVSTQGLLLCPGSQLWAVAVAVELAGPAPEGAQTTATQESAATTDVPI